MGAIMARHEPQASGAGGLRTVYRFLLGRLGALSVWLLRLLVPPVSGMKMTRRHPACCPGPACHQAVLNSNASPAHITFPSGRSAHVWADASRSSSCPPRCEERRSARTKRVAGVPSSSATMTAQFFWWVSITPAKHAKTWLKVEAI